MARTRSLKPDFFTDADLCAFSPLHRLLFEGLWVLADREGRLEDKPRDIKIRLLPFDDCDVDGMLSDLSRPKEDGKPFIRRYRVEGKRCIEVVAFRTHQHCHRDEKPSVLPEAPVEHRTSTVLPPHEHRVPTVEAPVEHRTNTPGVCNLVSVTGVCNLESGDGRPVAVEPHASPPPSAPAIEQMAGDAVAVHAHYLRALGAAPALLTFKERQVITERLREGFTPEVLQKAITGGLGSKWHRDSGHTALKTLLADADRVRRNAGWVDRPPQEPAPPKKQGELGTGPRFDTPGKAQPAKPLTDEEKSRLAVKLGRITTKPDTSRREGRP